MRYLAELVKNINSYIQGAYFVYSGITMSQSRLNCTLVVILNLLQTWREIQCLYRKLMSNISD